MEKLTNLAQLRSSSLEARKLAAQVVEAASKDMEALADSFLPRDGSRPMTGDLKLGDRGIVFGDGDVYLCDGYRPIEGVCEGTAGAEGEGEESVEAYVDEAEGTEVTADFTTSEEESSGEEETAINSGTDEGTGTVGETGEPGTEEGEESGAEGDCYPAIEFMQLYSATLGGYVPLSVGAPVRTTDAATKGYVDGLVGDIASILDTINGEVA